MWKKEKRQKTFNTDKTRRLNQEDIRYIVLIQFNTLINDFKTALTIKIFYITPPHKRSPN